MKLKYAQEGGDVFVNRVAAPPRQRSNSNKRRMLLGASAMLVGAAAVAGIVAMSRQRIGVVHHNSASSTANVMNLLATTDSDDTFESLDIDLDGQLSVQEVMNRLVARMGVIQNGLSASNLDDDTKDALNELIAARFEIGAACIGKLFESGQTVITAESFPFVYPTLGDVCETKVLVELERAFGTSKGGGDGGDVARSDERVGKPDTSDSDNEVGPRTSDPGYSGSKNISGDDNGDSATDRIARNGDENVVTSDNGYVGTVPTPSDNGNDGDPGVGADAIEVDNGNAAATNDDGEAATAIANDNGDAVVSTKDNSNDNDKSSAATSNNNGNVGIAHDNGNIDTGNKDIGNAQVGTVENGKDGSNVAIGDDTSGNAVTASDNGDTATAVGNEPVSTAENGGEEGKIAIESGNDNPSSTGTNNVDAAVGASDNGNDNSDENANKNVNDAATNDNGSPASNSIDHGDNDNNGDKAIGTSGNGPTAGDNNSGDANGNGNGNGKGANTPPPTVPKRGVLSEDCGICAQPLFGCQSMNDLEVGTCTYSNADSEFMTCFRSAVATNDLSDLVSGSVGNTMDISRTIRTCVRNVQTRPWQEVSEALRCFQRRSCPFGPLNVVTTDNKMVTLTTTKFSKTWSITPDESSFKARFTMFNGLVGGSSETFTERSTAAEIEKLLHSMLAGDGSVAVTFVPNGSGPGWLLTVEISDLLVTGINVAIRVMDAEVGYLDTNEWKAQLVVRELDSSKIAI